MGRQLRTHLWNRAVLLVFALPTLGYVGFLSRFLFGNPSGLVRVLLEGMTLFALPLMILYSALLDTIGHVDQTLGTAGFFIFAYTFAVILVWSARQSMGLIRGRQPSS